MPTPNQPTGGSPEQYDPYIANYGRKWSQMDPLTKRKLIEGAPVGGAGTGLSSRRIQEMVHHDVVPPWVGTGPMNTGYKRSGSQALEELKKIRRYAHPELFEESVQPFISPTPAPSVALADLAGSAALSSSSLDPFLFSPTSAPASSALGDVLVPFDPDLGTVPIGDQAPVTVSSGTDPNIFSAQVEEPTTFSQGGAAMPGLGFRPLGYSKGAIVENPSMTHSQAMAYIKFIHGPGSDKLPPGERIENLNSLQNFMQAWENNPEAAIKYATRIQNLVGSIESPPAFKESFIEEGASISPEDGRQAREERTVDPITQAEIDYNQTWPTRQGVYDDAVRSETFEQFRGTQPTIGVNEAGYEALRRGETLSEETPELLGAPAYTEDMTETWQGLTNPPQGTSPFGARYQAGGHVGRGTMAGELGRRGDLSVRQAGETMQERWKRMHGYAGGGYASRGTVAGELPRYGHMSVREEGESMGELAKRHRDQDWYNRMGRGLGSLRRRMA